MTPDLIVRGAAEPDSIVIWSRACHAHLISKLDGNLPELPVGKFHAVTVAEDHDVISTR